MDIELQNISLSFSDKKVIQNLSFKFESGYFYLIKGPSGCGKSTLLRVLSKLVQLDAGKVNYEEALPVTELRRKIHLLTQLPMMFEGSVEDNILMPFTISPFNESLPEKGKYQPFVDKLFPEGLDLTQNAQSLSQGQKQRVALCRTLLINPDVLLCDEPAASLDAKSREIVDASIEDFYKSSKGKMVIYISHHDELYVNCSVTKLNMEAGKLEVAQ